MKVLFDFGHPGDVNLFRNTISILKKREHHVLVAVRERENSVLRVMKRYNITNYVMLYPTMQGLIGKAKFLVKTDLKLLKIAQKWDPDVFISMSSPYAAHVSKLLGKKHFAFEDTEDALLTIALFEPFTDIIVTEETFNYKFPVKKHIKIPTWKPLAYLHPKYFKPNKKVLDVLGVEEGEPYFIVRFSAWDASHDWKLKLNINWESRKKMMEKIARYGKVFISSEVKYNLKIRNVLPLNVPEDLFLDALAFSSGYIGEGHTLAREAVCFGKPSILISPRAKYESVIVDLWKRGFIHIFESYEKLFREDFDSLLEFYKNKKEEIVKTINNMVDLNELFVYLVENSDYAMREYLEHRDDFIKKFKFKGGL